jgi:hypothetical protein
MKRMRIPLLYRPYKALATTVLGSSPASLVIRSGASLRPHAYCTACKWCIQVARP